MSTRAKILTATGIIFFVCLIVWVVRTTPTTPPPQDKVDPPTVMEYEGNTITEEKDGVIIWELTCEKMHVDTVTQNIELDGITGKYYQHGETEKTWTLTAKTGTFYQTDSHLHVEGDIVLTSTDDEKMTADKLDYYEKESHLHIAGNVDVLNKDGAKLTSDELDWFGDIEKLIATGNVKITKDDMRAFGDMAYADSDYTHFGLLGNAKVLKGVRDDEPTE